MPSEEVVGLRLLATGVARPGILQFKLGGSNRFEGFVGGRRRSEHGQENVVGHQSGEPGQDAQVNSIVRRANQEENIGEMAGCVSEGNRLGRDSQGDDGFGEDGRLRSARVEKRDAIFQCRRMQFFTGRYGFDHGGGVPKHSGSFGEGAHFTNDRVFGADRQGDFDGQGGHVIGEHSAIVGGHVDMALQYLFHPFQFLGIPDTDLVFQPMMDFRLGESPFPVYFPGWDFSTHRHLRDLRDRQVEVVGKLFDI